MKTDSPRPLYDAPEPVMREAGAWLALYNLCLEPAARSRSACSSASPRSNQPR